MDLICFISILNMKKIAFISAFLPTKENIWGPSSLPFMYLKKISRIHELHVYTFMHNVSSDDNVSLNELKKIVKSVVILNSSEPTIFLKLFSLLRALLPSFYRFTIPEKLLEEIRIWNFDIVYWYPNFMFYGLKTLVWINNIVIWGPDCWVLRINRKLRFWCNWLIEFIETLLSYLPILKLEKSIKKSSNLLYHVCWEEDLKKFSGLTSSKTNGFFTPHPCAEYDKIVTLRKKILLDKRINVIISGWLDWNNPVMYEYLKQITQSIDIVELISNFHFTFHGKVYQKCFHELKSLWFSCELVGRVDDYVNFISWFDIHLFTIDYWSGTKGKVLQSMALWLLCLWGWCVFENIFWKNNTDYIQIWDDLTFVLQDIFHYRNKYSCIAIHWSNSIDKFHSPKYASNLFWNYIFNYNFLIKS